MRRWLPVLLLLVMLPPLAAQGAPALSWTERLAIAEKYRVAAITQRRFTHQQFWDAVSPSLASPGRCRTARSVR